MRESLEPGSTLGSYRIEKLLGKGGMGEVYLAEDHRLKREVALKVLPSEVSQDPTYLRRFHREAEAAAALHHSNICTIYEIGESDGQTFIAMEYCEGATLQQRLVEGPMDLDEILEIGIQIADALEEARKKKIVHRDIKSSNILLTERKQVKVLDFGLAKHTVAPDHDLSKASTAAKLTDSGIVVGTVAYMSPEQALGKLVDHRSDIFSFGVVLYEMLTGRMPFPEIQPPNCWMRFFNQEDFEKALAAFQRALQLDPKMAEAAGEIAMLYEFRLETGAPLAEALPQLESWARKAISINKKTCRGWIALTALQFWQPKQNRQAMLEYSVKAIVFKSPGFHGPPIVRKLRGRLLSYSGYRGGPGSPSSRSVLLIPTQQYGLLCPLSKPHR